MNRNEFMLGIRNGFPICLGYFSVSLAFGVTAVLSGLPPWMAVAISMTNLTSAGQFAGVNLMVSQGTYAELAVSMLIINIRYFLMSLSLSQKVEEKMTLGQRLLISFGITDEIFAVAGTAAPGSFCILYGRPDPDAPSGLDRRHAGGGGTYLRTSAHDLQRFGNRALWYVYCHYCPSGSGEEKCSVCGASGSGVKLCVYVCASAEGTFFRVEYYPGNCSGQRSGSLAFPCFCSGGKCVMKLSYMILVWRSWQV